MRKLLALVVSLASCADRSVAKLDPSQHGQIQKDIPVSADIDLLFVIDNSTSTSDKQALFAQNFPRFIQALDAFPTGRPNLHVGVITTSVDIGTSAYGAACQSGTEDGRLQSTPLAGATCPVPTGRFISDMKNTSGTRTTNYAGTLEDNLACIAKRGTSGCGFEAPLEAIKRALDGSRPENAGFIRDGAYLAVVILTDEDDCSAANPALFGLDPKDVGPGDFRCQPLNAYACDEPISPSQGGTYHDCHPRTGPGAYLRDPADYVAFLTRLKGNDKVVVALIAGDPTTTISTGPLTTTSGTQTNTQPLALQPSCSATILGQPAIGRPAIRLSAFEEAFGDHGMFGRVCQSDYSGVVGDIGKLLFSAISPCLEGNLVTTDLDPGNPGTQPDCAVSDVASPDTAAQVETTIPACAMTDAQTPAAGGARPCWWIADNPAACATTTGLELHVERTSPPPTGTSVRVRCETD